MVNRNQNADAILERVRANNIGGQQNVVGIVEQVLNRHGFNVGYANHPYVVSPFTEIILQTELPRGWKVPKFSKFSGEVGESTVEHIARYQIEAGDLANNEELRMKYFPSSLTKNAFTWFTTLAPHSIYSWNQLERSFHEQFFRGETKVTLMDLVNIKRSTSESIDDYLNRFRQMKARCFTQIPEYELVQMAAGGLDYSIRKKLINQQLRDMAQLADKVRQIEHLRKEKEYFRKPEKIFRKEKVAYLDISDESDFENDIEDHDVHVAELKPGPPYVCPSLKPDKNINGSKEKFSRKSYGFDISKADQIFDILLKDKQIVLSDDHKIPSQEQRRGKKYCKYHNTFGHWTNNCVRFRDIIQDAIKQGRLKFEEKTLATMKVDSDPLQVNANYAEPVSINMVEMEDSNSIGQAIEMALDQAQEVKDVFPKAGETLVDFLTRKKKDDASVELCPRCHAVFDRAAAKTYLDTEMKRHYQEVLAQQQLMERNRQNPPFKKWGPVFHQTSKDRLPMETNKFTKGKQIVNQEFRGNTQVFQGNSKGHTFVPSSSAPVNQWVRPNHVKKQNYFQGSYHRPYSGNKPYMTKTQWRRAQRMKKAAFENQVNRQINVMENRQQKQIVFSKDDKKVQGQQNQGLPLQIQMEEKNPTYQILKNFEENDEDLLTQNFETGFDDALDAICGVISVLPADYADELQRDLEKDDFEEDEDFEGSEELNKNFIYFTCDVAPTHQDTSAVFEKPTEEMQLHMKPLFIKALVGGMNVGKVLVDSGAAVNLMPKFMMKRLMKTKADLMPHQMIITDFSGKTSKSEGVLCLELTVGTIIRPTMFVVVDSKANYNLLLGREWIHGVGAVPSSMHQKLCLWNKEGMPIYVEGDKNYFRVEENSVDVRSTEKKLMNIPPCEVARDYMMGPQKVPFSVSVDPEVGFMLEWNGGPDEATEKV